MAQRTKEGSECTYGLYCNSIWCSILEKACNKTSSFIGFVVLLCQGSLLLLCVNNNVICGLLSHNFILDLLCQVFLKNKDDWFCSSPLSYNFKYVYINYKLSTKFPSPESSYDQWSRSLIKQPSKLGLRRKQSQLSKIYFNQTTLRLATDNWRNYTKITY